MNVIVGGKVPNAAATARQNVLALNTGMFELYGEAGQLVQGSILAQHPVILGLFSGAGGRFILYRPGQPPLEAPPVPEVYQLLKSVGHSIMALGVVVGPHIGKPDDQSWRAVAARLSRADEGGARQHRRDLDAGRLARQQPPAARTEHRLHGQVPGRRA